MRSCANGRQWKGAIAGGQCWLNARNIAGHGSVMSAETWEIGFLGRFGIIESPDSVDIEGCNSDRRARQVQNLV